MGKTFPKECRLYRPGHQTHLIQLNVQANKQRFAATIELLDPVTLVIRYNGVASELKTHDALRAHADSLEAWNGEINFSPESQLLFIRRSGPSGASSGSWRPYYLTEGELEDCSVVDEISGYFKVEI